VHTVSLGIVAHVDAGKTSLTERLLFAAGVIDEIGSVDDGSTQTDTLELERQRGITIKSAVASFSVGGVTVNLIDTPGHPDFIAEVERALSVLDGAVLVVSAVEGVQAQTRVLMRTLRGLRIPTLVFVNKIDRTGAREQKLLQDITTALDVWPVPMVSVTGLGSRDAAVSPLSADDTAGLHGLLERLAEHDDDLLAAYVDEANAVSYSCLRAALAAQTRRLAVHPVYFGSAITGAGVDALMTGIAELLPAPAGDASAPVSGRVFKIERGRSGEKVSYVRLFSGTVRTRDRVASGPAGTSTVTAIDVFDAGSVTQRSALSAGQIGRVWGLGGSRVGDVIGTDPRRSPGSSFGPPTLETVVTPVRPADRGALYTALTQLAEQDPLINLTRDDSRQEIAVSLYGEVQKEVVQATLEADFGVEVRFRETTTICIERPSGSGAAFELISMPPNPFLATVGLRVDPEAVGSGLTYRLEVEPGSMPIALMRAVEETVADTLRQGVHGWQVTDCTVTLTHSGYYPRQSHAHAVFDKSMSSTAGDFRNLTPLVLMSALTRAGTTVHEPMHRFRLELPADALGPALPVLGRLGAVPDAPTFRGSSCLLQGHIPAAKVHALRQRLPGLSHGEGVLESEFAHYQQVRGVPPSRPRSDHNPLDRKQYLLAVTGLMALRQG
jgi:ribosomal protection tetracycline resistance protein